MDPSAALARIRELLATREYEPDWPEGYDNEQAVDALSELTDLVDGLVTWVERGGFLPEGGWPAVYAAAEAWRRWITGNLVRMQELDDTEQGMLDALAQTRCGQCGQCAECRKDAPFAGGRDDR